MNIQEFNNLKAGDMVKVKCPICHDCGRYYIGRIVDKVSRIWSYPFIYWEYIVKIDAIGFNGVEIDIGRIVRKIEKPEKRTAYWCKTRDEAEKFLEDCEAWGIKWCMGEDATKFSNWKLGKSGVCFYLRERGAFVNGDNCITWFGKTYDKLEEYDYIKCGIDRYIKYPSGKVLWDRAEAEARKKAEEEAKKKAAEVLERNADYTRGYYDGFKAGSEPRPTSFAEDINNLGKAATLADDFSKLYQEAWTKAVFAKMYADTDSKDCCYKNSCGCANYKPKEVKRSAKVGEYIKIVKEWHSSASRGKYTNGDIGLVTMLNGVAIKATINGYDDVPVGRWEYVVLENYIPEVKEVKRPAKAGEYIKIIKPLYTFNQVGDILKVDHIRCNGGVYVRVEDHPRDASKPTWWTDSDSWYYGPDKYVVLENYRP